MGIIMKTSFRGSLIIRCVSAALAYFGLFETAYSQSISRANQGYSMKIQMDNRGVLGRQAYAEGPDAAANAMIADKSIHHEV